MLETGDRLFSVVANLEGNDTVSVRESASTADAGEADQPPLGGEGDPLAAAIHTRETQYVPDVEQRSDDWSDRAGAADVGSAFAVPIERNGVPDGAFGIYFGTADALDADRRERVADLVSSLGDAVHLVERMSALAADSVVRVRLSVEGEDPLTGAAAVADGGIAVEVVRQVDGNTSMYVDVASEDEAAVSDRLSAEDGIDSVETVHGGDPARLHVTADAGTLPGIAVERGASVDSLEVRSDGYAAAVDVGPSGDVSGVVEAIEDRYDRTTVRSIRSHEREDGGVTGGHLSELTDRQLAALRTAYVEGYFETPRERSAEEIAGSMSIAGSTFLQHLRAAERKLLSSLLSVDSSADGTD
jgi:predicted DNA binding protein